jgi:ketosteroid isomerase-like protein
VRIAALPVLVLALAACGGHKAQTPQQVARAWSAALNAGDNAAAAALFADNAHVIQDDDEVLGNRDDATRWNEALPCGGTIVGMTLQRSDEVIVTFQLKERPGHACDGPGQEAAAVFRVEHGKIVVWHQVPPPAPGSTV